MRHSNPPPCDRGLAPLGSYDGDDVLVAAVGDGGRDGHGDDDGVYFHMEQQVICYVLPLEEEEGIVA